MQDGKSFGQLVVENLNLPSVMSAGNVRSLVMRVMVAEQLEARQQILDSLLHASGAARFQGDMAWLESWLEEQGKQQADLMELIKGLP